MKVASDTHLAPAWRRWVVRVGLAMIVAIAIGYVPPGLVRRDPRAAKLAAQLDALRAEGRALQLENAAREQDVIALRNDIHAIEARARADFSMVYPDEVVLQIERHEAEHTP
jgi:hypothetical protein